MIKELSDLPQGVVGFEATGTLRAEDYRDAVLPALERASASGEVRFVVIIPEFHGMSGGVRVLAMVTSYATSVCRAPTACASSSSCSR